MSTDGVLTLVASIIALITSIVTIIITIWHQNSYDKKHRRVVPAVSFWDTTDNIIDRMNSQNARIFTAIEDIATKIKKINLCVCLKNSDKHKINNCVVTLNIDGNRLIHCSIGSIIEGRESIIPVILPIDSFNKLECKVDYYTEAEEHLIYKISTGSRFSNRKGEVFLISKIFKKEKKLNMVNNQLCLSYSMQELIK